MISRWWLLLLLLMMLLLILLILIQILECKLVVQLILLLLYVHSLRAAALGFSYRCDLAVAADQPSLLGLDVPQVRGERLALRNFLLLQLTLILLDASSAAPLRRSSWLRPLRTAVLLVRRLGLL